MLLFTFIFYAVTITGMGLMYHFYGKSDDVSLCESSTILLLNDILSSAPNNLIAPFDLNTIYTLYTIRNLELLFTVFHC